MQRRNKALSSQFRPPLDFSLPLYPDPVLISSISSRGLSDQRRVLLDLDLCQYLPSPRSKWNLSSLRKPSHPDDPCRPFPRVCWKHPLPFSLHQLPPSVQKPPSTTPPTTSRFFPFLFLPVISPPALSCARHTLNPFSVVSTDKNLFLRSSVPS